MLVKGHEVPVASGTSRTAWRLCLTACTVYLKFAERKCYSHRTRRMVPRWGDGRAISLNVKIGSQCVRVSSHHTVHLKYLQFLFAIFTPVKVGKTPDLIVRLFCVYNLLQLRPTLISFQVRWGHRACPRDRGPFWGPSARSQATVCPPASSVVRPRRQLAEVQAGRSQPLRAVCGTGPPLLTHPRPMPLWEPRPTKV